MSDQTSFQFGSHDDLLFCLDMANNHQGIVAHGKRIIEEIADVAERTGARVMIKLQFRDLDSLMHPADRTPAADFDETVSRHANRFNETALTKEQFGEFVAHARKHGLPIYATPFDEASVDQCLEFDFDVIKIASASAYDWPLLHKVASTGKPVILSLGGTRLNETDEIVDYFEREGGPLALMHCVSAYPTPLEDLYLDYVRQLKERYPDLTVGYSGHEDPEATDIAGLCVAKGAEIIERHVGVPTDEISLNKYSLTPVLAEEWIKAAQRAVVACANEKPRPVLEDEQKALQSLRRGIYARRTIPAGKTITEEDVFLATPCLEGQFHSGKYYEVVNSFTPMEPVYVNMPIGLEVTDELPKPLIASSIAARVKELLDEAKITLDVDVEVELSHQYGFDHFFEIGAVIIDVVNRDYCKKLIIQFPNQKHPAHKHIEKEETFQVLSGSMDIVLDGEEKRLTEGQQQTVERGQMHSFATETGVIFEEVSTTHIKGDSVYDDDSIPSDPATRKTKLKLPR